MLTLVLHGGAEDAQQAASLAFNLGVKVVVVGSNGIEILSATPMDTHVCVDETVAMNPELVGHDEVTVAEGSGLPTVDEPHPVLEKADPPSVETVPEPVVPAPAETPAE